MKGKGKMTRSRQARGKKMKSSSSLVSSSSSAGEGDPKIQSESEISAGEVTETMSSFVCGNCNKEFRSDSLFPNKVTAFSLVDTVSGGTLEISVFEALATLFNIKFDASEGPNGLYSNLEICYPCSVYLAEMYRNYQEFLQLSTAGSEIYELIKLSLKAQVHLTKAQAQTGFMSSKEEEADLVGVDQNATALINGQNSPNGRNSERLRLKRKIGMDENSAINAKKLKLDDGKATNILRHVESSPGATKAFSSESKSKSKPVRRFSFVRLKQSQPFLSEATNLDHVKNTRSRNSQPDVTRVSGGLTDDPTTVQFSKVGKTLQGFNCLNCGVQEPRMEDMIDHLVSIHTFDEDEATSRCEQAEKSFEKREQRKKVRTSLPNVSKTSTTGLRKGSPTKVTKVDKNQSFPRMKNEPEPKPLRPYCQQCNKSFSSTAGLYVHTKFVHQKLRPFSCSVEDCDMKFSVRQNLTRHLLAHTRGTANKNKKKASSIIPEILEADGVKLPGPKVKVNSVSLTAGPALHQCDVCLTSFKLAFSLSQHKLKHQVERPFLCTLCDRAFKTQGDVKRHKIVHQSQRNFVKCPFCRKLHRTKKSLTSHLVNEHEQSEEDAMKKTMLVFSLPKLTPKIKN